MILIQSSITPSRAPVVPSVVLALVVCCSLAARAAAPLLLDDYSDPKHNKNGAERLLIDDKGAGSSSKATQKCDKGVLSVKGDLVPGRGAPAFISLVSLLSADGKPKDMSGYAGVRVRVKITKGTLNASVTPMKGMTPYAHGGNAPAWILAAALFAVGIRRRRVRD